VIKKSQRLE